MSKYDISIIAGLSGVGKTYTINALRADSDNYVHFSAGTLIKKRLAMLERDQLRALEQNKIIANQYVMIEQLEQELEDAEIMRKVLFDAHMIIDSDEGVIQLPYEIFERLSPSRFIFLTAPSDIILARRKSDTTRKRPMRTEEEIFNQQSLSISLAMNYCERLKIPFTKVDAGNLEAARKAVRIK